METLLSFLRRPHLTIRAKIFTGFAVLALLALSGAWFLLQNIREAEAIARRDLAANMRRYMILEEYRELIIKGKILAIQWVFQPQDEGRRKAARHFQLVEYPEMVGEIQQQIDLWTERETVARIEEILKMFNEFAERKRAIMDLLAEAHDYSDPEKLNDAQTILLTSINPLEEKLLEEAGRMIFDEKTMQERSLARLHELHQDQRNILIGAVAVLLCAAAITAWISALRITRPIELLRQNIVAMTEGRQPTQIQRSTGDEIDEAAEALEALSHTLNATTAFAHQIGQGDFAAQFVPRSDEDRLGQALLAMRDNLHKATEEIQARNWLNEGYARFSDLLRQNSGHIDQLCDALLPALARHLSLNQVALFVLDNESGPEPQMTLAGMYAWDKRKYLKKRFVAGEGLAGQVWRDRSFQLLTDIPSEYAEISSGLGKAKPTVLCISPLTFNEQVYGILEIASFKPLTVIELEFVQRLSQSTGSILSVIEVNRQTERLLAEAQRRNEEALRYKQALEALHERLG